MYDAKIVQQNKKRHSFVLFVRFFVRSFIRFRSRAWRLVFCLLPRDTGMGKHGGRPHARGELGRCRCGVHAGAQADAEQLADVGKPGRSVDKAGKVSRKPPPPLPKRVCILGGGCAHFIIPCMLLLLLLCYCVVYYIVSVIKCVF